MTGPRRMDPRNRMSGRINRRLMALELRRSVRPALIFMLGIAIAIGCMTFIFSNVAREVYTATQSVRFELDTARGVVGGVQDVRFKGIRAGSISEAKLVGDRAVIDVKVEKEYGTIYRDAKAVLRPETVLQDMTLDIVDPGTPAAGRAALDAPVPAAQTRTSINVADVLQTFSPGTRTRLATMLTELGGGLDGRGEDLRQAFVQVTPFLQTAGDLSAQLERRATLTRRLVHNASALTGELANRETRLRTLAQAGAATVRTTADGAADLQDTLAELPPTMTGIDRSFAAVRGVLGDVDGALAALRPVADRLPSGLRSLRALSDAAQPAVTALREPIRRLVPLANTLPPLSDSLRNAAAELRPQVPDIDHTVDTLADCNYAVERFFQWTPSVLKMSDARGTAPRAYAVTGLGAMGVGSEPALLADESCAGGRPVGGEPGPGGSR